MRRVGGVILLILVVLLLFFRQAIGLYVDWLWFGELGYTQLFTTMLYYKSVLGAVSGGLLALLIYVNLKIASTAAAGFRFTGAENIIVLPAPELIDPLFRRLLLPGALLVGLMAAPQGAALWEQAALFINPVPFNLHDPQFGEDIGFHVFRLAGLRTIYHWAMFALAITVVATAAVYLLYRGIEYSPRGLFLGDRTRTHLLTLLALVLVVKAGGYYLDVFDLLYSSRGYAYGAGYADIYGKLPVLRVLAFLALIAAGLCPTAQDYMIAAHRSAEPGHDAMLKHLRLSPLLDLKMRLGEGTGAALGMGLADAACKILCEKATFEEAQVSGKSESEKELAN